jgi:hypothetical protein
VTANTYRFLIALGGYCAVGWALGQALLASGWPPAINIPLGVAFVLVFGALTFFALQGGVVVRLTLVALLAPVSHICLLAVFGDPFHFGLAIQEAALLLLGAGVAVLWQWATRRIAGARKKEA